jgi:acyl-coenzyme A synthetase/AMP-(fatty) acid ligase
LLRHARERLSANKLPKAIEVCAELPHLASGKLDKRGLRDLVLSRTVARDTEKETSHAS